VDSKRKLSNRVIVLIDGSNFYHRLKEIGVHNQLEFDYYQFANYLSRDRKIVWRNYYVGVVRAKPNDKKAQRLRRNQQRLFAALKKAQFGLYFGYLLKSDKKYHEKGVDVNIAVDLLVGAYEDQYDTAILVSSDTDLIPVILKVRQLGKKVEYVGFGHKPSLAMIANCDFSRLLGKEDLKPFIK